jgi:hypothetical protein
MQFGSFPTNIVDYKQRICRPKSKKIIRKSANQSYFKNER